MPNLSTYEPFARFEAEIDSVHSLAGGGEEGGGEEGGRALLAFPPKCAPPFVFSFAPLLRFFYMGCELNLFTFYFVIHPRWKFTPNYDGFCMIKFIGWLGSRAVCPVLRSGDMPNQSPRTSDGQQRTGPSFNLLVHQIRCIIFFLI
jgi:hypothetical protein